MAETLEQWLDSPLGKQVSASLVELAKWRAAFGWWAYPERNEWVLGCPATQRKMHRIDQDHAKLWQFANDPAGQRYQTPEAAMRAVERKHGLPRCWCYAEVPPMALPEQLAELEQWRRVFVWEKDCLCYRRTGEVVKSIRKDADGLWQVSGFSSKRFVSRSDAVREAEEEVVNG